MMGGSVSWVTGRRQGPALRLITVIAWILAGVGALSSNAVAQVAGILAIGLVTAAPLLRVGWLVFRWVQEQDLRFVWIAVGLFVVIGVGAVAALAAG